MITTLDSVDRVPPFKGFRALTTTFHLLNRHNTFPHRTIICHFHSCLSRANVLKSLVLESKTESRQKRGSAQPMLTFVQGHDDGDKAGRSRSVYPGDDRTASHLTHL